MMDESDDDFKELFTNFLQRVNKNGTKELSGERKKQKAPASTQLRRNSKRPKLTAAKSKAPQGPTERKIRPGSQATRTKNQGAAKSREQEMALAMNGEGHALAALSAAEQPALQDSAQSTQTGSTQPALWNSAQNTQTGNVQPALQDSAQRTQTGSVQPGLWDSAQSTQTEDAPGTDAQLPSHGLTTVAPSPSKLRAAELVIQRMQQFKRADPTRLTHAPRACSREAAVVDGAPEDPQEEPMVGVGVMGMFPRANRGCGPGSPTTESDGAVALALQQELGQERAPTGEEGLEEKGWFFCQICQKNISAMNVMRREQHVNRCLDEAEKALRPSAPQVPECPICGKLFLTSKSRSSHLKQCAVKMEVCPKLLLQAVRLQAAPLDAGCGLPAPSFSPRVGSLKRKGAPIKEPRKRQKVNQPEAPSKDILVAMALSRSEVEPSKTVPALRLESAFSERIKLGTEKKSRKKKLPAPLPPLLVRDSEAAGRQMEERVATLFAEEAELSSTPPLPVSRLLMRELEKAGWHLPLPEGKQGSLWQGSALAGTWASEAFYSAGLVPPIEPWQPAQGFPTESPRPLPPPDQPEPQVPAFPTSHNSLPLGCSTREAPAEPDCRKMSPSYSQREHQALQDLVDLAGEGLSPRQGPSSGGLAGWGAEAALGLVPSSLPLSGFVPPLEEERLERGGDAVHSLSLLASDFGAMVNNPHLSDVQFQVDSGDVLHAHKFVLYARCPRLMQHVNSEGFFAVEDGDLRTQRVLLGDISAEAAHAFLCYLYAADAGWPPRLAPSLRSLALRFGVTELVQLCEGTLPPADVDGGLQEEEEEDKCESRAENFQELLRAMWAGEEEETEALRGLERHREDREKVDEAEMEEIYEFAATQRKFLQEERAAETDEAADQPGGDRPASGRGSVLAPVGDTGQKEASEQGIDETPARRGSAERSAPLPLCGQRSVSESTETRDREVAGQTPHQPSNSSPLGKHQAERKEGTPSPSMGNSGQVFPSPQGESAEPAWVTHDQEEQKGAVVEEEAEASCSPGHPQAQPTWAGSPSWSHTCPHHTGVSCLLTPPSQTAACGGVCQNAQSPFPPPKQRRYSSISTVLTHPGCQEGRGGGHTRPCKSKRGLVSPEKSTSIDLTQPDAGHLCSRPPRPPSSVSREDEVILLLDSDEELELEQPGVKPSSNDPPQEKKVLEVSGRSSELFSIIDIDADLERSPSPLQRTAEPQRGDGQESEHRVSPGGRGPRRLFCDPESSPEDSTADTSWLVPATPRASGGRRCSSQTQNSGLWSRSSGDLGPPLRPRVASGHRAASESPSTFPVIVPQTAPPCLAPAAPGSPGGPRGVPTSPCSQRPRHHPLISPVAPRPLQRRTSPETRRPTQAAVSEVVEVEDSDDEQGVAPRQANNSPLSHRKSAVLFDDCCWSTEPLSPIPIDHLNLERTGPLSTSSPRGDGGSREAPGSTARGSPSLLGSTPIRGGCADQGRAQERAPWADALGGSSLSLLSSALWDDWDGDEKSPAAPSRAQRLSPDPAARPGAPKTPKGARGKKNLPPKVPITPMPRYSIMETPVLKKELDRFGVRPLPKRKMVLKLKEIFQYTHQTLESDSDDEIPSSQVPPHRPRSLACAAQASETSEAGNCPPLETTTCPIPQRPKGPTEIKSPQRRRQQPGECPQALHIPGIKEEPLGSDGDARLPASQESTATSADSNDGSFGSQSSSSREFGAALESEGDDEGEERVTASQAAVRAADTEEAAWRYIRSQPALYRKVLLYQPLELAELQAELRQNGIRMATGKLMDFLDTHCITFTTAAARKEQLRGRRRRPVGKKLRGPD